MKKNNWSLIFLASIISAAVALLFAPKPGKELRDELKNKAMNTKDSFQEGANNLKHDFQEAYLEAEKEVELELANLDARQRELRETIESIENELKN